MQAVLPHIVSNNLQPRNSKQLVSKFSRCLGTELAVSKLASGEKEHDYFQMQTSEIIKRCDAYQLLEERVFRVDLGRRVNWCSALDCAAATLSVRLEQKLHRSLPGHEPRGVY